MAKKQPWPPHEVTKDGVAEIPIGSWQAFMDLIENDHSHSPAFIYRGQANAKWLVNSTLDRLEARFPTTPNHYANVPDQFNCPPATREQHLEAFKEGLRGKRGSNPSDLTESEWWALAQHHGLASPHVDWAYSPFVALFFAFEEEFCIDYSKPSIAQPERRAVFAASSHLVCGSHPAGEYHPAPYVFSPRREITNRLSSQSGVLMHMPPNSDLESNVRLRLADKNAPQNRRPFASLTKITIPNEDRLGCLRLLNKMNINRMSLFPDLDGAARYVNGLWELDFDTGLGALPDGAPLPPPSQG